jgi:hypothetical protein
MENQLKNAVDSLFDKLKSAPPVHHKTTLEDQIQYMEFVSSVIKTPLNMAIVESLKELKANNKNKTYKNSK